MDRLLSGYYALVTHAGQTIFAMVFSLLKHSVAGGGPPELFVPRGEQMRPHLIENRI